MVTTQSCSAAVSLEYTQFCSICQRKSVFQKRYSRKREWDERSVHRAGNALTDDLGNKEYDLIFIGNLLHYFDEKANQDIVMRSAARALRPGGYLVIEEFHRFQSPKEVGELGTPSNLYFAATNEAGTWSTQEIAQWQREAGLLLSKPIRLHTAPGTELQAALKPDSK
jgi:chemotaxis methyl-accepting protein methylase